MATPPMLRRPHGYIIWPYFLFILLATGIIAFVSIVYLVPVMHDTSGATSTGRDIIRANALLIMSLLLIILGLMLLLAFRISRYLSPRRQTPQTPTTYVDAWSESAKRLQTPPDDES